MRINEDSGTVTRIYQAFMFIFITLWFHTQSRYCVQYKSNFTFI